MVIVGVDEVGRGCWAGPLVVGAVVLRSSINGLKDSKKLSPARREQLSQIINDQALAIGLGWVDAAEIDRLGLTLSTRLASIRALQQINIKFDEIIIDGNVNFLSDNPRAKAVVKADNKIPAVSAASIVAKVARDKFMSTAALSFPGYGFETHVGYGTAHHIAALKRYGICVLHRRSYKPIQLLLGTTSRSITTSIRSIKQFY
jgi:ribonuclease HII